jgi:hypothetical protein
MKGNFSIKYDYYTDELFFCNLGENYGIGYLKDAVLENSRIGLMVAHDVVEHSTAQRRKTYVTYEDEIRAVGAIEFVRGADGFDMYQELISQVQSINRNIKPVPYIIGKFLLEDGLVSTDMMRYLIQNGVEPSDARNACYQYSWGNYQKTCQFDWSDYAARYAFDFIERHTPHVIREISDSQSWGASVYFDTHKHIFKYRMKWYH